MTEIRMTERAVIDAQTPSCRNVNVAGRRTSVRMELLMWRCLDDIREREGLTINQICTLVDQLRRNSGLTAALRVFIVAYYREIVRDATLRLSAQTAKPLGRDAFGRSQAMAAAVRAFSHDRSAPSY